MSAPSDRQRNGSAPNGPLDKLVLEVSISLAALPVDLIRSLLSAILTPPPIVPPAPAPGTPPPESELGRLRATLANLDTLPLAAILRELGAVLYNRDIRQWSALADISDELVDETTVAARRRLLEQALAADGNGHPKPDNVAPLPPPALPDRDTLRAKRRSRRPSQHWKRGAAKVVAAVGGIIVLALVNTPDNAIADVVDLVMEDIWLAL